MFNVLKYAGSGIGDQIKRSLYNWAPGTTEYLSRSVMPSSARTCSSIKLFPVHDSEERDKINEAASAIICGVRLILMRASPPSRFWTAAVALLYGAAKVLAAILYFFNSAESPWRSLSYHTYWWYMQDDCWTISYPYSGRRQIKNMCIGSLLQVRYAILANHKCSLTLISYIRSKRLGSSCSCAGKIYGWSIVDKYIYSAEFFNCLLHGIFNLVFKTNIALKQPMPCLLHLPFLWQQKDSASQFGVLFHTLEAITILAPSAASFNR